MEGYYDSIASGYDELHEEEQLKKLALIKKAIDEDKRLADFKNPKRLLDVGCGSGISTRFFQAKNRTGIDPSKELIKIAKKNDPKGKYIISDAETMPFNKKEFDIVISLTAIQSFSNISKALKKIHESGDRFILTFLKKSLKRKVIENLVEKEFQIIKKIEEYRDMIYFCY
ncbi:TPA: class I SAM-dependent methyltransferase [Candidatus Woesearchaeota archaeon]|nr:class I SAM-dependent methyltransferase [Candidatus Woesearchaeota archaeon]HIH31119.1 class I SAM-dependent methyltransferase [Candidatus Woesearchaeota archaeon]HIH54600.1 class I SAM-dependent methyltransferase [Candidatus Woesearchaeota archaeon]HIJ02346.1 class I SAM-dependent methyltransferase [Candidatus Woesearchaeota archaeon]HIJ14176.1 class I SAM-dependent methyltransferase [Candidatus Woesearchaeota archaeon]